jgi:hypothetical protein
MEDSERYWFLQWKIQTAIGKVTAAAASRVCAGVQYFWLQVCYFQGWGFE